MTYAQILEDLKQNVKPDEMDVTIHNVRKTKNGNVLLLRKVMLDLNETMTKEDVIEVLQTVVDGTC